MLHSLFHCIAREELIKLQRDYRKSEGLRKSITEASQNDIRKQKYSSTSVCIFTVINFMICRAMIVMLESENEELRKNLGLASSKQNERRDQMVTKKFEELLTTQGMLHSSLTYTPRMFVCVAEYERRIKEEEEAVEELDGKVKEMQKLVSKQRKDMGGYVEPIKSCILGDIKNVSKSLFSYLLCVGVSTTFEIHRHTVNDFHNGFICW